MSLYIKDELLQVVTLLIMSVMTRSKRFLCHVLPNVFLLFVPVEDVNRLIPMESKVAFLSKTSPVVEAVRVPGSGTSWGVYVPSTPWGGEVKAQSHFYPLPLPLVLKGKG